MSESKFYGIAFIDNSIGERDVAYSVAVKRNGEYYHLESNRPVLEYVGDEIINVVEISLEAKRKPLPDGTLPMTDEEKKEFKKLVNIAEDEFFERADLVKDHIQIWWRTKHCSWRYDELRSIKAILWLAERYELSSNN